MVDKSTLEATCRCGARILVTGPREIVERYGEEFRERHTSARDHAATIKIDGTVQEPAVKA